MDGTLFQRGPGTASGYVGRDAPQLADAAASSTPAISSSAAGTGIHFLGRRGGVINVGGAKVNPEEVEAVINRHPAVLMSRVRGAKATR